MSNIDMNKNSENGSSNYTGDDKFVIKNLNLHYGDFSDHLDVVNLHF